MKVCYCTITDPEVCRNCPNNGDVESLTFKGNQKIYEFVDFEEMKSLDIVNKNFGGIEMSDNIKVDIVIEIIRLTNSGFLKWDYELVDKSDKRHQFYISGFSNEKHKYEIYTSVLLERNIQLMVLSDCPRWVEVDGTTLLTAIDKINKEYTSNCINGLYDSIKSKHKQSDINIVKITDFLEELKNIV